MTTENNSMATSSLNSVRLPTVQVAKRFGVVPRTIERWQQDDRLGFPKPLTINLRKYWSLEDLEKWERRRAVRTAA
jgi:hypothetical protein